MKRVFLLAATSGLLAFALHTHASDFVWDGTIDNNWTNGPQNNSGGGFPANGITGSNWTINGGGPAQVAPPDTGTPGGNMIDYLYSGHHWTIDGANINENVQVRLDGGSINVSNSTISLLPSSANTGAFLSAFNLGQNGNPTAATFTNSTLNVSRSNGGGAATGRSLGLIGGSTLDLIETTVNVSAETMRGKIDLNNGSTLTLDSTSSVTTTGHIDLFGPANTITMAVGASINTLYLRANSGNETSDDLMVNFGGGTFTVSDVNPFRDNSAFEGQFNWTGGAGSGVVVHTGATSTASDLANKVSLGYFSINGVRINPVTNPAVSGIPALNAELATIVKDGTWFVVNDNGSGIQTLTLVPEPASLAPLGLCALAVIRHRRV